MPLNLSLEVRKSVTLYKESRLLAHKVHPIAKNHALVIWRPHPSGWDCLNFDGATKADSSASCSGIFRDNCGVWLGGFHNGIRECNSFAAEF